MDWIDAKIAVPSNPRCVLVVAYEYSDDEVFEAYFKDGEWNDTSVKSDPVFKGVDYWIDLPKPPKR
jgi:hypothetical protein